MDGCVVNWTIPMLFSCTFSVLYSALRIAVKAERAEQSPLQYHRIAIENV